MQIFVFFHRREEVGGWMGGWSSYLSAENTNAPIQEDAAILAR